MIPSIRLSADGSQTSHVFVFTAPKSYIWKWVGRGYMHTLHGNGLIVNFPLALRQHWRAEVMSNIWRTKMTTFFKKQKKSIIELHGIYINFYYYLSLVSFLNWKTQTTYSLEHTHLQHRFSSHFPMILHGSRRQSMPVFNWIFNAQTLHRHGAYRIDGQASGGCATLDDSHGLERSSGHRGTNRDPFSIHCVNICETIADATGDGDWGF